MVTGADGQPGILARLLASMLTTAREMACLSCGEAAARLGRETDWLARVESGLAVASPEEVARLLVVYGMRGARAAGTMIDMARRVAAPPPWLGPHAPRMSAASRDVLLVEAEATLARGPRLPACPLPGAGRGLLPRDRATHAPRLRRRPGVGPARRRAG